MLVAKNDSLEMEKGGKTIEKKSVEKVC